MILMVSGRTDIIGFYYPWLLNRIKEGYVDTRNPFNEKQVYRYYFKDVDAMIEYFNTITTLCYSNDDSVLI